MHPLTLVFVVLLLAGTMLRLWLALRQLDAVRAGRARVPAPFDTRVTLDDHHKAADYTVARDRIGIIETLFDAALLLGWTLLGGLALIDRLWSAVALPPLIAGTAVILSTLLVMSVL